MPARRVVPERQFLVMLEYMERNRDFAVGCVTNHGPQEKISVRNQWEQLALSLNAVADETHKTAAKWRDFWADKKYQIRKKATEQRQHGCGTGGGPPSNKFLTEIEKRLLAILGKVAVMGEERVRIPFPGPAPPADSSSVQPPPISSPLLPVRTAPMLPVLPAPATAPAPAPATVPAPASAPARPLHVSSAEHAYALPQFRRLSLSPASPPPAAASDPLEIAPALAPTAAAAQLSPAHSPLPHAAPSSLNTPVAPSRSRPTSRRLRPSHDVPQWALEMEQRRQVAEERTAQAVEALAASGERSARALEKIATNVELILTRVEAANL